MLFNYVVQHSIFILHAYSPITTSSTAFCTSGGLNDMKDRSHLNIRLSLRTMFDILNVTFPTFPVNDPKKVILPG